MNDTHESSLMALQKNREQRMASLGRARARAKLHKSLEKGASEMTGQKREMTGQKRTDIAGGLFTMLSRLHDRHAEMTVGQARAFMAIAMKPGLTQKDLWKVLDVTDSSASRYLTLLSDIGRGETPGMDLVSMKVNPLDRRERILDLTPKGKRLIDDLWADIQRAAK
jgi:DNA-binding MarR family transcriptional regulator